MKKFKFFAALILISSMLFSSGFRFHLKKNRPLLFFYNQPITNQTMNSPTRYFTEGEKIYYILVVPLGFKDDYIRAQLIKKEEKTQHWGYKVYWSKDFPVERGEKYFKSYVRIDEAGYYFFQIYSFDDFDWPLARNDFWVRKQ